MIFIDSNIPMYLVGASHPHKADAQLVLERVVGDRERLVTDAEVFQEILHRYAAIDRRAAIPEAFNALLGVVDDVFPIDLAVVEEAKRIVLTYASLSARDAVHVAVLRTHGIDKILTFDSAFDGVPGIERIAR